MKLNRFISIVCIANVNIFSTCALTSCFEQQNEPPLPPEPTVLNGETAQEYIYHRTFSLHAFGTYKEDPRYTSMTWGTGWIISHVNEPNSSEYEYYIATNWHVITGEHDVAEATIPETYKICYGCSYDEQGLAPTTSGDYKQFASFTEEPAINFSYFPGDPDREPYGIDFYVAKVDFGSGDDILPEEKENLDFINNFEQEHGYITKSIQSTDDLNYAGEIVYMGGYPVRNRNRATWGYKTIQRDWLVYKTFTEAGHQIDNEHFDVSPQYTTQTSSNIHWFPNDWMPGGASGSMCIAAIDDQWQVIAIYWGGSSSTVFDQFWPYYSIFNSDTYNFIERYI